MVSGESVGSNCCHPVRPAALRAVAGGAMGVWFWICGITGKLELAQHFFFWKGIGEGIMGYGGCRGKIHLRIRPDRSMEYLIFKTSP